MKRPVVIGLLIVALALVCAGIVAVGFFAANNTFTTNNPLDRRNIPSAVEESKTLKVDAGKPITLNVTSDAGDITVTGADVDTVQVRVVKTAYDSSQSRADAEVKNVQYSIEQSGNTITLKYELNKSMNFSNNVNTVDFVVTVPTEATIDVNGGMGKVGITGLQGQVAVDTDFGDITIKQVQGTLDLKTNSGGIDAASITAGSGDVHLSSGFGTISMSQVSGANVSAGSNSGKVDLENVRAAKDMTLSSDFGNVRFENGAAGTLTASTKSGSIDITSVKVSGTVTARNEFGNVNLEQVNAQSYDLQTNSGAITVDGARGMVKADTGFGNITIKNAENATLQLNTKSGAISFEGSLGEGPHTVHSDFGDIEIAIPADTALNVDFKTDFGRIRSDLPVTMTPAGDLDQTHQAGTINRGGSELSASTKSGNITISALGE